MADNKSEKPPDNQTVMEDPSTVKKPTNPQLDVVIPGEEDDNEEIGNRNNEFERSAVWAQSAASGIQREKWGSKGQFLMSIIASAVGLGNVWRFPAICARNGGATFLIPYIVVLFVIARPLFVLELSLGQFSSKGSVRCWDLSPAFTGIGWCGVASSVLLSTFYIMLLAWALIYSVISFTSICYNPTGTPIWSEMTGAFFGGKVLGGGVNFMGIAYHGTVENWIPVCHLVLALIFAWMVIWITMVFGVEASGKVAYITALAPYVVLITLLISGCCLPGAGTGLKYLLYPDIHKLFDGNTWFQAVGQCFFSLGIGFGGCIMFSSYNDFHNDIIRDVLLVSIVDSVTSLLAGISLMSILGFQAEGVFNKAATNKTAKPYLELRGCALNKTKKNDPEDDALKTCAMEAIIGETGGAGLAFVHYPAAMNEINVTWGHPLGTFFGLLFFLMLILLAVGSANGFVGTTVTVIADKRPKWKRSNIVSGVCAVSCLLGMIYTNSFGTEWFDVVDIHGVTAVVYVLAFFEVAAIVYVYGLKSFCDDLKFMRNGKPPGLYLRITWMTLAPLMLVIYFYWMLTYKAPESWTYSIKVISWLLTACCLLIIPFQMVLKFIEFRRNPWRRNVPHHPIAMLKAIFKPNPRWGPKDPQIRIAWKEFKSSQPQSFEIWKKMRSCWYRLLRRPEPSTLPTPRMSYAPAAFPLNHPNYIPPPNRVTPGLYVQPPPEDEQNSKDA